MTLDTPAFRRQLDRVFASTKRGVEAVGKEQARGVLRRIIATTPPGNQHNKGKGAHQAGKRTVAAQIGKIFEGVPAKKAETRDIEGIHQASRTAGRILGRTRDNRKKVPKRELKQYILKMQAKVGYLVSGWKAAASRLGVSVAAWISKHDAPGAGEIIVSNRGIRIILKNAVRYVDNIAGMKRRVNSALQYQAFAMENRMKQQAEAAAAAAGLGS